MGNQNQIRQLTQARMHAGQLPCAGIYEVFGRKGDGLSCACCDDLITREQIEYDVEVLSEMGAVTTLPMHVYCYHVWYEVSTAIRNGERAGCSESAASSTAISLETLSVGRVP